MTEGGERARRYGLIGALYRIAFVVAPAMGGLLGEVDPRFPFAVSAALASAC